MADVGVSAVGGHPDFGRLFESLTGHEPFPWQADLFSEWFVKGNVPSSCSLPTGLGKTSVMAIWLIALAHADSGLPRRLVYVVNRRTVVDQATGEAERLRANLAKVPALEERLRKLCALDADSPLGISTLRGQFADNAQWRADPVRPAIIIGTVDMIGSRLLFSGYGVGFKSRPLHAGFLGQNALLVHDEAHLEPAFQKLIKGIEDEQDQGEKTGNLPWPKLRVMAMTATARDGQENGQTEESFELTQAEKDPPDKIHDPPEKPIHHVWRRLKAAKRLRLTPASDDKQVIGKIAQIAAGYKDDRVAVLVFVRTLEAVKTVESELKNTKRRVVPLTGTMRGKERDELVEKTEFKRFLKGAKPGETVYLVCTSAGEVGIDISADHLVCDLTPFDSMAQRFGRVNRFGDGDAKIDVVHETVPTEKQKQKPYEQRRWATLSLLQSLPRRDDQRHDASPHSLGSLCADTRQAAFTPSPVILPATDILFDAWALTSIREKMPGRPLVEPYLHGIADWQPPETNVAWRQEVEIVTGEPLDLYPPADLLDDYPLKPHELLRDRQRRVFEQLQSMARRHPDKPAWVVDDRGAVEVTTLRQLADKQRKDYINGCTILLPPSVGGLSSDGLLDGASEHADDVADVPSSPAGSRIRVRSDDPEYASKIKQTAGMRLVRRIEISDPDDEDAEPLHWEWYESLSLEGGRAAPQPVTMDTHVGDVVCHARRIVQALSLPKEIADAVILAAKLHDCGKRRKQFQTALGNRRYPEVLLAKVGPGGARLPEPFRHEFASAIDTQADPAFNALNDEMRDLVLHLIAAHHGRARPHFPPDEAFDPDRPTSQAEALAIETPRRFASLQRKYGRWGLAYLESLLRAADWAASASPSAFADDQEAT